MASPTLITSFRLFSRDVIPAMYHADGIDASDDPKEYGRLNNPASRGVAPRTA